MNLFRLPPELLDKVFSELALQAPVLEIIQDEATPEQKARVVAGKAYHVISTVNSNGDSIYSHLGFSKKFSDGSLAYATAPLDKKSVFYTLLIQEPARVGPMTDAKAPRDTYAFYFLEQAIEAEEGVVFHLQDRIRLAGVCQRLRGMMNPSQERSVREGQLEITLRHVLFGDPVKAEQQLKASPSLLLLKNTHPITDFSGKRVKNLTPFQAALCAGDVEMCEMMKKIFEERIKDGETLMQEQFNEIFPDGIDASIKKQQKAAFNFDEIITVICRAPISEITAALKVNEKNNRSPLCQALKKFRDHFEKISDSEKIFNPYHLLAAFKACPRAVNDFQSWEQRKLFCCQVIGFVQRYLPACYIQAFAQNLRDLTEEKKPLQRSFKFECKFKRMLEISSLHLSCRTSCVGLGFNYLAYNTGWYGWLQFGVINEHMIDTTPLQKFCQTKISGFTNLYQSQSIFRV
ncbi:MAG: hypothetical protein A3F10_06835 [Coxiella sp. RIFCSPHIGHO2_12_FULL_42_15]|nr:MAG: hypothetical protein A3F10_06835 [Coxiella sp. RIFCSPHIGHO2_12_FULL_42_15]